MNESGYKRKVRALLQERGWLVWCVADRYHAGRPDLIAFRAGRCVALELKWLQSRPQKRSVAPLMTDIQRHELCELIDHGIRAWVLIGSPVGHWLVSGDLAQHTTLPSDVCRVDLPNLPEVM